MGAALALGLVFVVSAILALVIAPAKPNVGFSDSAAVLAFVSLVAVAIERIIEGLFVVLAGPLGEWWPFSLAKNEFDRFETQTNDLLGPIVNQTISELDGAKAVGSKSQAEIDAIDSQIEMLRADQTRLSQRYAEVTAKLAPGSSRLARVGEINTEITKQLTAVHTQFSASIGQARTLLSAATETADRATLILSSFKDNPARRLASLALGTSLGMLVAGAVGLNLFLATLVTAEGSTSALPAMVSGSLGIVMTGIILGLGSAPTHEVVKSLQAYRDNRTTPQAVTTAATAAATATGVAPAGLLEMPGGAVAAPTSAVPRVIREVRRTG
jgi:hypothetical protein